MQIHPHLPKPRMPGGSHSKGQKGAAGVASELSGMITWPVARDAATTGNVVKMLKK
jgi:hypothetical protein